MLVEPLDVAPGSWRGRGEGGGLTDNEGNHGCSITTRRLKALDELLDLPYLNLFGLSLLVTEVAFACAKRNVGRQR